MPSNVKVLATALLLSACNGGHERVRAAGAGSSANYQTTGLASWYGEELSGAHTASGALFDPRAITAAHRTLPLGSFAEVTSLETGQSIVVLINDRGPGRKDRVIDLSRGAAQQLGFGSHSVAAVRVLAVTPTDEEAGALRAGRAAAPRHAAPGVARSAGTSAGSGMPGNLDPSRRYQIQIASFANEARARALARALDADVVPSGSLWRVRIGPLQAADVQPMRDAVAERGYGDAQILPAD